MAALTETQKRFVVERLACFETPAQIKKAIQETFGVDVSASQVCFYDPNSAQGSKELSKELKALFFQTRERFITDEAAVAVSHRTYRLRRLQKLLDDEKIAKNPAMVMDLLEQAAKEVGGMYTNKREISGPSGKPIEIKTPERDEAGKELDEWRKGQMAILTDLITPPAE